MQEPGQARTKGETMNRAAYKAGNRRTGRSAQRDAVQELKTGKDTTINVGRWTRYLAASEAREGGVFNDSLVSGEGNDAAWAGFAREVFAKLYGLGETEGDIEADARPSGSEWVVKLHEHAESLPEWQALKARSQGDPWACGVAAGEALNVARGAVQAPTTDLDAAEAEAEFIRDLQQDGMTSPKHLRRLAEVNRSIEHARREAAEALEQAESAASGVRVALRSAIAGVNETLDQVDAALGTMGLGAGGGAGIASRVAAPRAEVRAALLANPKLLRVLQIAGRLKTKAIQKQRTKARPGAEELCDITVGADLARLVPAELGNLADETTEALLVRRLMERSATCYELRGREQKAEGPIVMVVDESFSMSGPRDETAKAIALAMMEIAARQNRPFAYVRFADRVVGVDRFESPRALKLDELLDFVTRFNGGGTRIGAALVRAADIMSERGKPWAKADVIIVSDGDSHNDNDVQEHAVKRIKEAGAHVYGIFVATSRSFTRSLCDEVLDVTDANLENVDGLFAV